MPIQIPVTQTGLEASIEAAAKKAGKSLKVNMGPGAKSIEGLSQPLGRITGKADQFTKSMEAANARVLAFGASVGVLSAVTRGFKALVTTTIEVEKSLTNINSILGGTTAQLNTFKKEIFEVARNTEQSFDTVATAALELSRQGLKAEVVVERLNDALILSRLSGLGASEAVFGLTAAINSFRKEGISSTEVLNKLSAAAVSAAVSERDLIEGIKRSGSVAIQAGVSFDELIGVITAVQARTARGGAVIGNSFKTIFTRIQSLDKLKTMQNLGVEVTDASGQVLSATKLIQNLAKTLETLPDAKRLQIAEGLVGKFQIAPFLAILEDYNREASTAIKVTEVAANATNEAYSRNVALNEALSAAINQATVNLKELANTLGEIGVTDSLKNILGFFNSLVTNIRDLLEGEGMGSDFAKGLIKGIGAVLSGPGLAIAGAIIAKLTIDLVRFGTGSLKTFFGLNMAAKEQATLQGQIASTLLNNQGVQKQILSIENSTLSVEQKRAAQTKFFTIALNEQYAIMQRMQMIAGRVAPGVRAGTRGRGAGGYIPNFNATMGYGSERGDINRGVGGAPSSARPVTIPNFNFGGGQRGTMVANNSEYMVPNFAGSGGSAIFNQNMISSMGLPANAKRVGAAGGYIPNFAAKSKPIPVDYAGMIVPRKGLGKSSAMGSFGGTTYKFPVYGIDTAGEKVREEGDIKKSVEKFAIGLATQESKSMTGGKPTAGKISKLANTGAIGGLAGAVFETALSALLKSKDFDFGETATFDFVGKNAIRNIGDISPYLKGSAVSFLEAKISSNLRTNNSMAKKIQKYFGKGATGDSMTYAGRKELIKAGGKSLTTGGGVQTGWQAAQSRVGRSFKSSAAGYIPNFAGDLQNAIGREAAAGLPINQIRINRDSSLKNAGNPMGLAVTNMRDEPTGAIPAATGFIPNFNKSRGGFSGFDARTRAAQAEKKLADSAAGASKNIDKLGKSGEKVEKGQRDMLGGIFAVQIGMSALSGATSGATEGFGLLINRATSLGSSLTTAAFAGSAISGFGESIGGASGKLVSKLGLYGAALSAGISIFKFANQVFEDNTGITKTNNLALAMLKDAATGAAFALGKLSEQEKEEIKEKVNLRLNAHDNYSKQLVRQSTDQNTTPGTIIADKKAEARINEMFQLGVSVGLDVDDLDAMLREVAAGVGGGVRKQVGALHTKNKTAQAKGKQIITKNEGAAADFFGPEEVTNIFDILSNKELLKFIDQVRAKVKTLSAEQQAAAEKKLKGDQDIVTAAKEAARINTSIAQQQIKHAIDLAKADRSVLDSMDERILKAELSKSLTEDEMIALKTEESVLQANFDLRNKTLAVVGNMAKASKELTFKEKASQELQDLIAKSAKKQNFTAKERAELVTKINTLLEESDKSIQDILGKELDSLDVEEKKTKEFIEQLKKLGLIRVEVSKINQEMAAVNISALGDVRAGSFNRREALQAGIRERQLGQINRGRGAFTTEGSEGLQRQALQNAVEDAIDQSAIKRIDLDERQINSTAKLLEKFSEDQLNALADRRDFQGEISAGSLAKEFGKGALADAAAIAPGVAESAEFKDQLRAFGEQEEALKKQSAATLANAEANLKAAGFFALSEKQIMANMGTDLERGANQGAVNLALATDAKTRARLAIRENSRLSEAAALKDEDFDLVKSIREADQLKTTLSDASHDFAQNIGDAMVMAIARGEDLGDSLRSAASDFFLMLSKAFMQKAVNNIAGSQGGSGFIGGFVNLVAGGMNSGGVVKGGSGHRDDVPTMLTGGEFVMRRGAVSRYGSDFMESLNEGSIQTMQRGGLFRPGTYGQGAITGKKDLFNYATQGFTTGQHDRVMSGANVGSVNLEPHSVRMTRWGNKNSRMAQAERGSQEEALGLYFQQLDKDRQEEEQAKARKDALKAALISMVASAALSGVTKGFNKPAGTENMSPLDGADPWYKKLFTRIGGDHGYGGSGTGGVGGPSNYADIGFGPNANTQTAVNRWIPGVLPPMNALQSNWMQGGNATRYATGGYVSPAAGTDTVKAVLSGEEFVMNPATTRREGRGNLAALNAGSGGGGNQDIVGRLDELIDVSEGSGETVINITVNSDGTTTQDETNAQEQQQSLAMKIKDQVRQVIEEEKRLGGSLRQARA